MQVAYVLSQNSGGLPHYAAELANAIGQYADVIVLKPSDTTADEVFSEDIEVINPFDPMDISIPDLRRLRVRPIRNAKVLLSYRRLKTLVRIDPDVIHDPTGFFPQVRFFGGRYDLDDRYPLVVTYHEIPPSELSLVDLYNNTEQLFTALTYRLANRVMPSVHIERAVVHSETQREALNRTRTAPGTVDVIPHGVYDFFGDYDYAERPEEDNCLLFFGNVIPPKGIDTLVEAIPIVQEEIPDVRLLIAGKGQLSKQSKSIVEQHEEHFEIHTGFVPNDEVGEFFSRAQVAVLPYQYYGGETKGHSGVLSTAHSFGTPVVATTIGEFPSLVEGAGCGLTVPPRDPAALADGIVRVLEDDEQRHRMAENSMKQGERLSWDTIAKRYLDTYETAITSHRT